MALAAPSHPALADGFGSNDWRQAFGSLDKALAADFGQKVLQTAPVRAKFYRANGTGSIVETKIQKKKKGDGSVDAKVDADSDAELLDDEESDGESKRKSRGSEIRSAKAVAWLNESELEENELLKPIHLPHTLAMGSKTPSIQTYDTNPSDANARTSTNMSFNIAMPGEYAPVPDPNIKGLPLTAAKYLEPLFSDQLFLYFPELRKVVLEATGGVEPAYASYPLFELLSTQFTPKELVPWKRVYRARLGYKKHTELKFYNSGDHITIPPAMLEKGGVAPTETESKKHLWVDRLKKRFTLFGKGIAFRGGAQVYKAAIKIQGLSLNYQADTPDGPIVEIRWIASLAFMSMPFLPLPEEQLADGLAPAFTNRWNKVKTIVNKMVAFVTPGAAKEMSDKKTGKKRAAAAVSTDEDDDNESVRALPSASSSSSSSSSSAAAAAPDHPMDTEDEDVEVVPEPTKNNKGKKGRKRQKVAEAAATEEDDE